MKSSLATFTIYLMSITVAVKAQTANTSPLPAGETVIGGHLHAGAGNEVWSDANSLYFNYRGSAGTTNFWNLGGSGGKSIMTLLNSGFVGIGTPAPSYNLHVISTNPTISSFQYNGDVNYPRLNVVGSPTKINLALGASQTNATDLSFSTTAVADALIIKGSGRIGVGTTTPGAQLTVALPGYSGTPVNSSLVYINQSTNPAGVDLKPALEVGNNGGGGYGLVSIANNNYFSGNVGIGTTAPQEKLHVVGNAAVKGQVHANEVKVDLNVPGPDYVFEKDYQLTSLEEIKNYIDQNKHLPEVPSAKEMEKNGVQLGEMNMLLLKKIEELTLYVIELKKENVIQQMEIEKLKK